MMAVTTTLKETEIEIQGTPNFPTTLLRRNWDGKALSIVEITPSTACK